MRGIKTFAISLLLGCAAFAAQPDYFPLRVGNQWVYRCSGSCGDELPVLEISRNARMNDRWYSLLKGFNGRETWLRQDQDGVLWAYEPGSGEESRWYSFFAPEGESFNTSIDPCSPTASIASRNAEYRGPAGEFRYALHVKYAPGPCADAGLTEEYFLPWTGLIQRTEVTIAGPRTFDLIYSWTGGVTEISQPRLGFSLALDRSIYYANLMPPIDPRRAVPQMTARLTLRNTTDDAVSLVFPTSQRYDLEIRNEKGEVVYRWSEGKAFLMVFGEEAFGPGERNYTILVPLAEKSGKPLPQGRYVAIAWIATEPPAYKAAVAFEIQHVF